ncbi:phosphatase [Desulfopila sp. IMCC35008]|uniref:phosphatase n=1 Tax=Desulfopila sp. IMCC35008 TaxID=2653858 RepID=UPI0013D0C283|nr:phosphatase [Desulfopila sp. IMCC35008]
MEIEVDSHTHTVASGHAYSTLAENVQVAAERGLKLLAITDHGPAMPGAPFIWFFMNMKILPRIMNGVGLLRGVEANITSWEGDLDIDEDLYQVMDIVLVSLHEPVVTPTDITTHTDSVVKAMASGRMDVFAHGGNPAFPINADQVAKAAVEYNVLIEINNSSFTTSRQGSEKNCAALAEAVALHGGYLTFGSDAHLADKVGGFDDCRAFIETIGFPRERIMSCNGKGFIDFLKSRRNNADLTGFDPLFAG